MEKPKMKKLTGLRKKLLDVIKDAEDAKRAHYRRRRVSIRSLRLAGKLGVDEDEGVSAIKRKVLIPPEYASELLHTLHDEAFLSKTKLDKYTLSQEAIESMARELQKRGYVRVAVRRILRRQLAKRGYIRALREHKAPGRTAIIPPIIGYFK